MKSNTVACIDCSKRLTCIFPVHGGYSQEECEEFGYLSVRCAFGLFQLFTLPVFERNKQKGEMMRVILILVLMGIVAVSAVAFEDVSVDCPNGIEAVKLPPAPIFTDNDEDPWNTVFDSPVMHNLLIRDEGSSVWPESDWNNDILVFGGAVGSGQDFDVDEDTGDIYAICDTDHDGVTITDSAMVYRSQDGGASWVFWRTSNNSTGTMDSPRIRVVKDTSGDTWVCMFFLKDKALRMRYMNPDQSSSAWTTVTTNDVSYFDVDAEVGNNAWLYATYVMDASDSDVYAVRTSMDTPTWVDDTQMFVDPGIEPYPAISAGTGGVVSVSFLDSRVTTNQQVRIKNSSNYGSSYSSSAQVGNNSGAYDLTGNTIAYTHTTPATGWIFLAYDATGGNNLGFHYTTNSGSSWTYGTTLGGDGDQYMPDIRTQKAGSAVTLAFNDDPGDSTMWAWAAGTTPTSFTTPERMNEFQTTGYWSPTAGWAGTYSAVLYTSYSESYNLFFDWYGNVANEEETFASAIFSTGISSSPNPFTDIATINFSVTGADPVSISIFDISGRLVETLVENEAFPSGEHSVQWGGVNSNGESVVPGVYFCRLNSGGSIHSSRMVRVR